MALASVGRKGTRLGVKGRHLDRTGSRGSSEPAGEPPEAAAEKCQQASKSNALPDLSRSSCSCVPPASSAAPQTRETSTLSITDSAPRTLFAGGDEVPAHSCAILRARLPGPGRLYAHASQPTESPRLFPTWDLLRIEGEGPSTPRGGGLGGVLQRSEGKARKRRGCSSRRTDSPGKTESQGERSPYLLLTGIWVPGFLCVQAGPRAARRAACKERPAHALHRARPHVSAPPPCRRVGFPDV